MGQLAVRHLGNPPSTMPSAPVLTAVAPRRPCAPPAPSTALFQNSWSVVTARLVVFDPPLSSALLYTCNQQVRLATTAPLGSRATHVAPSSSTSQTAHQPPQPRNPGRTQPPQPRDPRRTQPPQPRDPWQPRNAPAPQPRNPQRTSVLSRTTHGAPNHVSRATQDACDERRQRVGAIREERGTRLRKPRKLDRPPGCRRCPRRTA